MHPVYVSEREKSDVEVSTDTVEGTAIVQANVFLYNNRANVRFWPKTTTSKQRFGGHTEFTVGT